MEFTINFDFEEFLDYREDSAKAALKNNILDKIREEVTRQLGVDIRQQVAKLISEYVYNDYKNKVSESIKNAVDNFKFKSGEREITIEEWISNRFNYRIAYGGYADSEFAKEIHKLADGLMESCFREFKEKKRSEVLARFEEQFNERMSPKGGE
jgi:hypothetical protein